MLGVTAFSQLFAQEKVVNRNDYTKVQQELEKWDPVRGPWLSSSLESMSNNQPIPDRTFPERFTPHQMLAMVPYETRSSVLSIANNARQNGQDQRFWSNITRYVSSPNCQYFSGRSYGDPHLVSFDGARNSFQTVGEFVLTKSSNGEMEVQTRQRPMNDDFSLNTAVAMNVAGDRVCLYARDYPDGNYSTPLRIDGRAVQLNASTYFLEHGGTIKKINNEYTVFWPSGESVVVQMRNSRSSGFMNVTVNVHDCSRGNYNGLLGNADGDTRNDYSGPGLSPRPVFASSGEADYLNRQRQAWMAREFAEVHRIQQMNSLFDYMAGRTTESYTDRSYPRVFRDFNDINRRQLERSRRVCEQRGIDPRDMQGCMYDNTFLGLEPSPRATVPDPVQGTVLRPVTGRVTNVNPTRPTPNPTPVRPTGTTARSGDDAVGRPGAATSPTSGSTTTAPREREQTSPRPVTTTPRPQPSVSTPRPVPTPRPTTRPTPRPAPKPVVKPAPRPTPKPAPKPTPVQRGGRR